MAQSFLSSSTSIVAYVSAVIAFFEETLGERIANLLSGVLCLLTYLLLCVALRQCLTCCRARRKVDLAQHLGNHSSVCTTPFLDSKELQERSEQKQQGVKDNYLLFLSVCRDMFLVLTIISILCVILLVHSSSARSTTWAVSGALVSPAQMTVAGGYWWIYGIVYTWAVGAVVLFCLRRMELQLSIGESLSEHPIVERTLWLSELPKRDTQTREWFTLDSSEFEVVEALLLKELNKEVNQQEHKSFLVERFQVRLDPEVARSADRIETPYPESGRRRHSISSAVSRTSAPQAEPVSIVSVHVAPVVEQTHSLRICVRDTGEREEAFKKLKQAAEARNCDMLAWYYHQRYRYYRQRARRRKDQLRTTETEKKCMSGSAFVIFKSRERRDVMLKQKHSRFLGQRDYALWNFGKVPFASVTLKCQRGPHPDDINWLNLQISEQDRFWRSVILRILLFTLLISSNPTLLGMLIQTSWLQTSWFSVFLLLMINSVFVPFSSRFIASHIRPVKRTHGEAVQFSLNKCVLIFNAILMPLVGKFPWPSAQFFHDVWQAMLASDNQWSHVWSQLRSDDSHECISSAAFALAVFWVEYILLAALFATANNMVLLHHGVWRAIAHCFAVTEHEKKSANASPTFDWGFSYSWAMCIVVISFYFGIIVPAVLPCAWLFFLITHLVDEANLSSERYRLHVKADYGPVALYFCRNVLAGWWFLAGVCIITGALLDQWTFPALKWPVVCCATLLCVAAPVLCVWSYANHHMLLRDEEEWELPVWAQLVLWLLDRVPKLYTWLFPSVGRAVEQPQTHTSANEPQDFARFKQDLEIRLPHGKVSEALLSALRFQTGRASASDPTRPRVQSTGWDERTDQNRPRGDDDTDKLWWDAEDFVDRCVKRR